MQMNRGWLVGVLAGVVALGVTGTSHAQYENVTFTSTTWNAFFYSSIPGSPTFGVNQPLETVSSGASMPVGSTVAFNFSNFQMRTTDSGGTGNVNSFLGSSALDFNLAGGTTSIAYEPEFFAVDNGGATQLVGIQAGSKLFTMSRPAGGAYLFNVAFNQSATNILEDNTFYGVAPIGANLTYVAVIPEPATLALFGLGLAPVAVAIRRRRK